MKRIQYILLSLLLSVLVVYMGVGIPFVQYRCMSCADTDSVKPLLMVAEVSDGGCDCGCAGGKQTAADGPFATSDAPRCCCGNGSGGCCGDDSLENGCCQAGADEAPATDNGGGCQKVRIEKINLPVLTDGLHLDVVEMPLIDYLFCNLIVPYVNISLESGGRPCDCAPPCKIHPRAYINLICTLLI